MSSKTSYVPKDGEDLAESLAHLTVRASSISDFDPTLPQNRPSVVTPESGTGTRTRSQPKSEVSDVFDPMSSKEAPDDLPFTSSLNACSTCGGHHYTVSQCIYRLDYTTYLTYHALYMSSLPHNLHFGAESDEYDEWEGPSAPADLSDLALWQRAEDLDDLTVDAGELKEELLTQSAKDAMADDEVWKERLAEGGEYWYRERDMLREWRESGGKVKQTAPTD